MSVDITSGTPNQRYGFPPDRKACQQLFSADHGQCEGAVQARKTVGPFEHVPVGDDLGRVLAAELDPLLCQFCCQLLLVKQVTVQDAGNLAVSAGGDVVIGVSQVSTFAVTAESDPGVGPGGLAAGAPVLEAVEHLVDQLVVASSAVAANRSHQFNVSPLFFPWILNLSHISLGCACRALGAGADQAGDRTNEQHQQHTGYTQVRVLYNGAGRVDRSTQQ